MLIPKESRLPTWADAAAMPREQLNPMRSYISDRPMHPLLLLKGGRHSTHELERILAGQQVAEGSMLSGGSVTGDLYGEDAFGVGITRDGRCARAPARLEAPPQGREVVQWNC